MTCGIYALNFQNTHKKYIGQSKNIEARFATHKYSLINGLASKVLQQAYVEYGMPSITILTECTNQEELDASENEAIEIYDAIQNGFNTLAKAGDIPASSGELNGRAKILDYTVEKVFFALISAPNILYIEVATTNNVSVDVVRRIASGKNHAWLSLKYPEEYRYLMSLKNSRRAHSRATGKVHPPLISPTGEIHYIPEGKVRDFCITHNLDRSHLGAVLSGKEKQHKEWKLHSE